MSIEPFDGVCLSSGGIRGIYQLGALQFLYDKHLLKNTTHFAGTSVGAIIAYLLAIGYTPLEIMQTLIQRDVTFDIKMFNLIQLLDEFAACKFNYFYILLEEMTLQKLGYIPTFKELAVNHGKHFTCTAYNTTYLILQYFDAENEPDMKVIDAIKASCSIPLVFPSVNYKECQFIDGAIANGFPLEKIDNGYRNIIAIFTETDRSNRSYDRRRETLLDYIMFLTHIPARYMNEEKIRKASDKVTFLSISVNKNIGYLSLRMTSTQKMNMYSEGYYKASVFFKEKHD